MPLGYQVWYTHYTTWHPRPSESEKGLISRVEDLFISTNTDNASHGHPSRTVIEEITRLTCLAWILEMVDIFDSVLILFFFSKVREKRKRSGERVERKGIRASRWLATNDFWG